MIPCRPIARLLILGLGVAPLGALAQSAADAPTGLQQDVVFDLPSPLTRGADYLARALSPLADEAMRRQLAAARIALPEQSVDLSKETFVVYVPAQRPPDGYALMVFVSPWPQGLLPRGWAPVLDRFGMIFVSATQSGNEENVVTRREPLALLAAANIAHRYKVDPDRLYVGGFSGGARVALRLALQYPDVFRAALLDAGSDPIGVTPDFLPAQDLLYRFQESTRLVFVTGAEDIVRLDMVAASTRSLRQHCVFDVDVRTTPRAGHEIADAEALTGALAALREHVAPDSDRLAACRAAVAKDLDDRLAEVDTLLANGKRDAARDRIRKIDADFGGLAAPRTLDLAERCGCGIFDR